MTTFLLLLTLIFLSPLAMFFFLRRQTLPQKFLSFFLGFAAGTFAFLFLFEGIAEVFPWSHQSWLAIFFLAAGGAANYLLDQLVPENEHHHHHCHHPQKLCHLATMATISLGVHNLVEGFTFGLLALTDPTASAILALMIILHNIPLNLSLLAPESYLKSSTPHILKHLFFANFPFVLGACSFFLFTTDLISSQLMLCASFFAFGLVIYLLIHEIIPIAWQKNYKLATIFGGLAGLLLVLFINFFE